jgi:hypothetical protein
LAPPNSSAVSTTRAGEIAIIGCAFSESFGRCDSGDSFVSGFCAAIDTDPAASPRQTALADA